jgi:hypothetical protein
MPEILLQTEVTLYAPSYDKSDQPAVNCLWITSSKNLQESTSENLTDNKNEGFILVDEVSGGEFDSHDVTVTRRQTQPKATAGCIIPLESLSLGLPSTLDHICTKIVR